MLIHPWDAATPAEWRELVAAHSFGQLVGMQPGESYPVVVPTHFVYDGDETVWLHLARPNPFWTVVESNPHVVLSVVADYTYIDAAWNAGGDLPPERGVPTSYYAAVQLRCRARVVDDPEGKLEILRRQLRRFEGAGSPRVPPSTDVESDRRLLPGVRGLELGIESVRAKMKYGGNKSVGKRHEIADRLAARRGPLDLAAREHLLRRISG